MNRVKVAAPSSSSGALSPIARERARIEPVAMPGTAAGSTCRRIVCHLVAPSASEPSRIEGGTARIASRAAMITIGSTSSVRVSPPVSSVKPRLSEPLAMKASPRIP